MIKCKKCGSSNVKVNFDTTYTIFPLKYGYKCQDCGEMDYMSCEEFLKNLSEDNTFSNCREFLKNLSEDNLFPNYRELLKNLGVDNTFPNNENVNHSEEIKGGLNTGWVCPKCGRCYSPFTSMCSYCSNSDNHITWKVTC